MMATRPILPIATHRCELTQRPLGFKSRNLTYAFEVGSCVSACLSPFVRAQVNTQPFMAAVTTNFAQAQTASQTTVNATARVLSLPSLLSYLK
jgi:hypothetical protein